MFFVENAALFMERFPILGLLASQWTPKETLSNEAPVEELTDQIELVYIYGLSLNAYEKYRTWLQKSPQRRCVFLEDDPGCIASFLNTDQAKKLLLESQVFIELISKGRRRIKELEAITQKFPERDIEVVALPSRKNRTFKALRLHLLRKAVLAHSIRFDRLAGFQLFGNHVKNLAYLPRSFYANGMKGAFAGIPAVVCGAGPSLQNAIPLLKQARGRILIIAGGSSVAALSSQGLNPHFAMAVDPNAEEYHRFKNSLAKDTPLLYSTRLFPDVFKTCNGPFGYMRTGIGGIHELWMDEQLGLKEPLLGDHLSEETLSVSGICLAWAEFLGCNPILLAGLDLAYTNKMRYAPGVMTGVMTEVPFDQVMKEKGASDQLYKRKDRNGHTVYTAVRWVMESAAFSHFAKRHPQTTFINTTDGGIGFQAIPYQSLQEALQRHCTREWDLDQRVRENIASSPMPPQTVAIIEEKMNELKQSLDRIIHHLEVLWKETSIGKRALAEVEFQEELATLQFFYDGWNLFGEKEGRWKQMYEQACRYRQEIHY